MDVDDESVYRHIYNTPWVLCYDIPMSISSSFRKIKTLLTSKTVALKVMIYLFSLSRSVSKYVYGSFSAFSLNSVSVGCILKAKKEVKVIELKIPGKV